MLPLITANAGKTFVFRIAWEPNQNPETKTMMVTITAAVLAVSFFQMPLGLDAKTCPSLLGAVSLGKEG